MGQSVHPVSLLFLPAALGIGLQLPQGSWDYRCIALALLLLCLDQARMAGVDLLDIAAVRSPPASASFATLEPSPTDDPRLDRFTWVTLSTIAIELIGFYLAWAALGWGVILVLISQLWFHGLAGVQLFPGAAEPVVPFGARLRSPVLIADSVGIILVVLWLQQVAPLTMALLLLGMVALYGGVKYGPELWARTKGQH